MQHHAVWSKVPQFRTKAIASTLTRETAISSNTSIYHTLAEDLLASQQGLCSMVLVSKTDMWLASATRIPGPFSFLGPYIHTDMLHTL